MSPTFHKKPIEEFLRQLSVSRVVFKLTFNVSCYFVQVGTEHDRDRAIPWISEH